MTDKITALLAHLVRLIEVGLESGQWGRSGYDGPFLSQGVTKVAPTSGVVRVFAGRDYPVALLVQVIGTGNAADRVSLGTQQSTVRQTRVVAASKTADVRILMAAHQELWAGADGSDVTLVILESKA